MLRWILHLSPLVPLLFHRYYLALAAAFLIVLSYVKVKKLEVYIHESSDPQKTQSLEKTLAFWKRLTFDLKA